MNNKQETTITVSGCIFIILFTDVVAEVKYE